MKVSVVVVLILLALIVLVSPGIVGRLAERSMDENLDWAVAESDSVLITSQGFDHGWFSSAGQHRVEVRDSELREYLLAFTDTTELPVLIIDTRLDHGLIPVASMTREHGSLVPGLGKAVSTLSVELEDGELFEVPGVIYSTVGITGELQSNYIVGAGNIVAEGVTMRWGKSDILISSDADGSTITARGMLEPISVEAPETTLVIGDTEFDLQQRSSQFGFPVGSLALSIASVDVMTPEESGAIGPVDFFTDVAMAGDRVSARTRLQLDSVPIDVFGPADVGIDLRIDGADGAAAGRVRRAIEALDGAANPAVAESQLQRDLQRLVAAGFELHVERFDVALPMGTIALQSDVTVAHADTDSFNWASAMLTLDATLDLSMPAELVDFITALNPEANAAVGLGYIRKQGDIYEMHAELTDGVLTINGAPMNLPLGAFQ